MHKCLKEEKVIMRRVDKEYVLLLCRWLRGRGMHKCLKEEKRRVDKEYPYFITRCYGL